MPTPPRSLVEKAFTVVRWSEPRTGGHFAPLAAPDAWTADVVAFTDELKAGRYEQAGSSAVSGG